MMNRMKTWRWVPAVLLLAVGWQAGRAGEFTILSFDTQNARIVFGAVDGATNYSVLTAPTPTGTWSVAVGSIPPTAANVVTAVVGMAEATAFYRVVAYTNVSSPSASVYLIVDLSGGVSASSYPVSYLDAMPPGGWTDEHKTTKLVLRRIPATAPDFTMGYRSTDYPGATDEGLHQVTLTEAFYLGVFEVTQRQWELVMGDRPSSFANATYYQTRPVEQVRYFDIRENPGNSAIDPNWPQSSQVHADSFMGKLRAKTGLSGFDLPTESQWEFACRAGTTTALNSGYNLTNTTHDARMDEVGRHLNNGGKNPPYDCGPEAGTALVGSYLPNAWSLYDMHGNVLEWCLDWHDDYPGTVTDPQGATSGTGRALRGGSYNNNAEQCRSAYRQAYPPTYRHKSYGFGQHAASPGQQ